MGGSVESRDVPACVIDIEAGGAFSALSASVHSEELSHKRSTILCNSMSCLRNCKIVP